MKLRPPILLSPSQIDLVEQMPGRARDAWERALDAQRGLLDEVKPGVMDEVRSLGEECAHAIAERFAGTDLRTVRNKSGFLIGIINKVKEEWRAGRLGGGAPPPGGARGGDGGAGAGCTIMVGGLSAALDKARLDSIFGQFGEVRDVRIAREHKCARLAVGGSPPPPSLFALVAARGAPELRPSVKPSRYAFVEFGDASSAQAAITFDGTEVEDHRLRCEIARRGR